MATGTNSKKRFVDIHLWDQPWYIDLNTKHQLFWHYMNAKCDNVGVYAHSERKTAFDIQADIKTSEIVDAYNSSGEKVKALDDGKFLLVDFCKFQHCNSSPLLPKSKVFVSYMKDLRDAGLVDYFAKHQKEVISEESHIFFRAFEEGILEFKYYSDNPAKSLKSGLTPYKEALQKAKEQLSSIPLESHTNGIEMPLVSHQGKGKGTGEGKEAGKGAGNGNGVGSGKDSPYYHSKRIAERLFNPPGESFDKLVIDVNAFAKKIHEQLGEGNAHELIEVSLEMLEEHYTLEDLTLQKLKEEITESYLPKTTKI